jgi:hypothetical protein
MLRTTVLCLIVGFVAVPTVESQQVIAPRFAEQPIARAATVQSPAEGVDFVPIRLTTQPVERDASESSVAREVSARTVLAIIGAVVVVGALIALLV